MSMTRWFAQINGYCFSGTLQEEFDRITWMQARSVTHVGLQNDLRRECDYLSSMIQGYPCYGMGNLGKIA